MLSAADHVIKRIDSWIVVFKIRFLQECVIFISCFQGCIQGAVGILFKTVRLPQSHWHFHFCLPRSYSRTVSCPNRLPMRFWRLRPGAACDKAVCSVIGHPSVKKLRYFMYTAALPLCKHGLCSFSCAVVFHLSLSAPQYIILIMSGEYNIHKTCTKVLQGKL